MSFNKAKALKTASKYVQQGKYQSAIEEYRQIAQADSSDVTTLNTLGDLYVKVGQTSEAIQSFLHIAEHYRMSGFYLKAIAMLKKVSKLDPDNVDVSLKLASLYAQQKLIVDARHQYLSVAERYVRDGQSQEALQIYQKIADLDPENTAIQIKLAEAYLREGENQKAYEAFLLAAGEQRRQGKEIDALQTYLRAIKANPKGQAALSSAVNLYLQRSEYKEAVDLLEGLLVENPNDPEMLTLLARVHQATDNLVAAESAMERMLALDVSRYQYFVDLGLLYVRHNDADGALRVFDKVAETLYEYREEEKAANLLRETLALSPNNLESLSRLANVYERSHDEHLLIETLTSIVDVALQQSAQPIAINALKQLRQLEPDEIRHRRRLQELEGEPEETSSGSSYEFDSADDEAVGGQWGQPGAAAYNPAPQPSPSYEFSGNEEPVAASDETSNQWGGWSTSESNEFQAAPTAPAESFNSFGAPDNNFANEANPHQNSFTTGNAADTKPSGLSMQDELESVDFYLSQGMLDVARYTLEGIAAQYPGDPLVAEKFGQLKVAEAQSDNSFLQVGQPADTHTAPATAETSPELSFSSPDASPATQEPSFASGEDELSKLSLGNYDMALGNLLNAPQVFTPSNEHNEAAAILSGPPLFESSQPPTINAPVFDEASTISQGWQSPEPAAPTTPVATSSLDLFAGDEMGEMMDFLDDFKSESEQHETIEDFETHYNLGLAYKEMEMFDEAIEEFQQAFKILTNDPQHPHYVSCCNMLGFCFVQKGLPRLAVMWLKKALESPNKGEEVYQALRYDLGEAYVAMGELQNAYDTFTEVYAIDVQYRNIKTKLQEVSSQMGK